MIRYRHIKMASRFLLNRFREIHPFEIQAYITSACNQKCVYCLCPNIQTKSLSTEHWKKIIHELGAHGSLRFKFQGGEPTLRKDFRDLSREAQAAGMITATVSNGILIVARPDLLEYVDELVISIDSPRESVNDRIRGRGAFQAAVRALDISVKKGLRTFINMVVIRDNLDDLEAMLQFSESKGALLNAQPSMHDRKYFSGQDPEFTLTTEESQEVNFRLYEWKKKGRGLLFSPQVYKKAAEWADFNHLTTKSEGLSSCMAGKSYFHIEPNGDVHPCGLHGADFTPKNIVKDGFVGAFLHAGKHNCGDCWMPFMNERKGTFKLKFSSLREVISRN